MDFCRTVDGTVVRAGQFHEFVRQTMARTKAGPIYAIPTMRSQPVAASEVADLLVDVAEQEPQGNGPVIAGPATRPGHLTFDDWLSEQGHRPGL